MQNTSYIDQYMFKTGTRGIDRIVKHYFVSKDLICDKTFDEIELHPRKLDAFCGFAPLIGADAEHIC